MNLEMQKAVTPDGIEWKSWCIGFHGEILDDRGRASVQELGEKASQLIELTYDPETIQIRIAGNRVNADSLHETLHPMLNGPVVLEATTLGFVEILLCCRALHELGIAAFDLVYVEPERYRRPRRQHLLHRRDFELSSDVPGYRAIPGNAMLLGDRTPQKGIFLLGYEEARLRRAFEDLQMIRPSKSAVMFGVPAFTPGWEMDAIANNISIIREQNIRGGVHFCGAENPAAVIEILSDIHAALGQNERLFIAPIGTKPHGIGVALFVAQHRNVGIIYDHPRRTEGRSVEIARWHLFSISDHGAGN